MKTISSLCCCSFQVLIMKSSITLLLVWCQRARQSRAGVPSVVDGEFLFRFVVSRTWLCGDSHLGLLLAGLGFVETPISAGKRNLFTSRSSQAVASSHPSLGLCVFFLSFGRCAARPNFVIERV